MKENHMPITEIKERLTRIHSYNHVFRNTHHAVSRKELIGFFREWNSDPTPFSKEIAHALHESVGNADPQQSVGNTHSSNAERQRRWKEKNRELNRQRDKEAKERVRKGHSAALVQSEG